MLHGQVLVNSTELLRWSATRSNSRAYSGVHSYKIDIEHDGRIIYRGLIDHNYEDGAAILAAKVLLLTPTIEKMTL